MPKLKQPPCAGHSTRERLQMRDQRWCEGMLRQRLEELGIAAGFQPFLEGWLWRGELHAGEHYPHPLLPKPGSQCPLQQQSLARVPLQSHLESRTHLSCSGEHVCTHSLKTKHFSPKRKGAEGREAKGKAAGAEGQKGRGSCALQPCLSPALLQDPSFW